jgi:glycosyltransferase involved in cell wall biosynthesis
MLVAGEPSHTEGELLDPAVEVVRLPLRREIAPLLDTRSFIGLRRLLRRRVLIHTHMAKAGALGRLAARQLRPTPRTVHTFHGHVLDGYFSSPKQRAFIEIERRLARETDMLIAVSEQVKESLLELGIGTEGQYRVIPLGFDLSSFLVESADEGSFRSSIGVDHSTSLIGVVGRLVPIKDHETLLCALQQVPDVHLAIVGDGELRSRLEDVVRSTGLQQRVHFTGWWMDMAEVYRGLDLVVLSSRNEGSPVALIEALASGTPAVATDVGGVRSVVSDGISGFLVPSRDPKALAEAIARLLSDPTRARRMGLAGREYVRDRFHKDRLLKDIRQVYSELLS